MFSHITGTILAREGTKLTIQIQGIGLALDIHASPRALSLGLEGQDISLPLHHHMTDQGEMLFGFIDMEERAIFRKLISVSGVGGKTAQNILGLGAEAILRAIELDDDVLLSSVPGIGKKTAQKIIVELKGSIELMPKDRIHTEKNISKNDVELISSLVHMGYDKSRVEAVIRDLDSNASLQERTIRAIQALSQ